MGKVYVKDGGSWKQVQALYVKTGGVWKSPTAALVTQSGVGKQFYPDVVGQTTYTIPGTYTYTVPATISSIQIGVTGGGGGGQAYYFNGGQGFVSNGASGTNTSITGTGVSATANGGGGGGTGSGGGAVSISGATSTQTSVTGGTHSGQTGGASYYGAGGSAGSDFVKPATPSAYGAGGGAGYYQNIATVGGDAGGTGIATFPVTPGQVLTVTVGAGGVGPSINYAQGSNHGSYAGNGAVGYAFIKPLGANAISYTAPGTYTFTPPAGVLSVNISYPTVSGLVTSAVSVTPGVGVTVTIGDYGSGSSFGGTSVAAFNKTVFSFSGNVDHLDYFSITAGSATGASYSASGSAYTYQVGAAAVGITLSEYSELYHGDLGSSISVNTVPSSTLINTTQIYGVYSSGRYQYELVQQQPSASNGYTYIVSPYDPGRGEGYYAYTIYLQQVVSISVSY